MVAVNGRNPLLTNGSAKWSSKFCRGLLPVTIACKKDSRHVTCVIVNGNQVVT